MNRSLRRVCAVLVLAVLCALPTLARTAARPAESLTENIFSTLWDIVRLPLRLFRTTPATQPTTQKDGPTGPLVAPPPDGPTTNTCPQGGCPDGDSGVGYDPNG